MNGQGLTMLARRWSRYFFLRECVPILGTFLELVGRGGNRRRKNFIAIVAKEVERLDKVTLRAIRIYFGMTQQQVADRLGMARSSYEACEAGRRRITPNLRMKVAQRFELTEDVFDAVARTREAEKRFN